MKKAFIFPLLPTFVAPLWGRPRPAPARSAVNQEYIAALATANRFLQAWQSQDHETGILLLSDSLKQHIAEDYLRAFFSCTENAQEAYEISDGKKLSSGRYIFSVALFNSRRGNWTRRRCSQMVVTRMGKNDWAVDKLP